MVRFVLILIIAMLVGMIFGFFYVQSVYVFIIGYIVVFAAFLSPTLFTLYRSKNIDKLERFIQKRLRYPYYRFMYGVANKYDAIVEETFAELQEKPRGKTMQSFLQTIYFLYKGNPEEAKRFVGGIQKADLKNYYEIAIAIEANQLEEAENLLQKPLKPWMRQALSFDLEKKRGNIEKAVEHAKTALALTGGIQYYIFFRTYQNEFPKSF